VIRVTIEMVPKGDESKAYTLAQGAIVNDGTGTLDVGNYVYGFSRQVSKPGDDDAPITRSGKIEAFGRKRHDVWELLRLALNQGDQSLVTPDGTDFQEES
jgi:hypothetical protein